jgi:hypothetical protein
VRQLPAVQRARSTAKISAIRQPALDTLSEGSNFECLATPITPIEQVLASQGPLSLNYAAPFLAMISTIRVNMPHSFRLAEMQKEPVARATESSLGMGCNAMPRGARCQLRQHLCRPLREFCLR